MKYSRCGSIASPIDAFIWHRSISETSLLDNRRVRCCLRCAVGSRPFGGSCSGGVYSWRRREQALTGQRRRTCRWRAAHKSSRRRKSNRDVDWHLSAVYKYVVRSNERTDRRTSGLLQIARWPPRGHRLRLSAPDISIPYVSAVPTQTVAGSRLSLRSAPLRSSWQMIHTLDGIQTWKIQPRHSSENLASALIVEFAYSWWRQAAAKMFKAFKLHWVLYILINKYSLL